jgi:hypothetical protein
MGLLVSNDTSTQNTGTPAFSSVLKGMNQPLR